MGTETETWQDLQRALEGSFSARASGIAKPRLLLMDRNSEEFGRLEIRGLRGAILEAEGVEAEIQRSGDARYRMFSGEGEILSAETKPAEKPRITCKGASYQARMSLLRNVAEAFSERGRMARIEGGFLGRRYEVTLGGEECALPVALFLLYHLFVTRNRAYTAAGSGE